MEMCSTRPGRKCAATLMLPELRFVICMLANSLKQKIKEAELQIPPLLLLLLLPSHINFTAIRQEQQPRCKSSKLHLLHCGCLCSEQRAAPYSTTPLCFILPAAWLEILLSLFMLSLCNIFYAPAAAAAVAL